MKGDLEAGWDSHYLFNYILYNQMLNKTFINFCQNST
jgi:hypothetical protein